MKTNVLITGSNGLLANNLKIIIKEESLENKYKFFFHNREMFDLDRSRITATFEQVFEP